MFGILEVLLGFDFIYEKKCSIKVFLKSTKENELIVDN